MKIGLMFANTGRGSSGDGARELAVRAEAAGYESLWTVEHVVVPSGYESKYPYDPSGKMAGGAEAFDLPDPLIWLAYVAASTRTIRLATGVLILPQRNPLITAKAVASIDHLSGGRMMLGVGVGWLKEEFEALGVPFADRGRRLDDYVEAMRACWSQDKATVDNTYTSFKDCIVRPQPVAKRVPIVIGGHTKKAAQRAARIGDGFFPGSATLDQLSDVFNAFRDECSAIGRDPAEVELTAGAGGSNVDQITSHLEKLAGLGVTRAILPALALDTLDAIAAGLRDRIGMDV